MTPQPLPGSLLASVSVLLLLLPRCAPRSSPLSDLQSRLSGVEELLEEFRQQLHEDQEVQEDQASRADRCPEDFSSSVESIIQARKSIEQGAAFLLAPERVRTGKECVSACCAQPRCTVAVVQEEEAAGPGPGLRCYLFNCSYRGRSVCSFSPQHGFTSYSRGHPHTAMGGRDPVTEVDEPPRSDAGQDVVIQLPTDWAVLDARDSVDDHAVSHYQWTLLKGDSAINMKSSHPGLLKVSGLQEGVYTFQVTVTDSVGQKSSDNVSVTVLAPEQQEGVCSGLCSDYQFRCDDGCCVEISYACDGKQDCPDRSDEDYCPHFEGSRKSVSHSVEQLGPQWPAMPTIESKKKNPTPPLHHTPHISTQEQPASQGACLMAPVVGPCRGTFPRWFYDQKTGACKHFLYGGCQGNHNNFLQEADCVSECVQKSAAFRPVSITPPITQQSQTADPQGSRIHTQGQDPIPYNESKDPVPHAGPAEGGHPGPESGAILPLTFGVIITALLLVMISCRLRLVGHNLKKTRPLTTEESDYLINGMYL